MEDWIVLIIECIVFAIIMWLICFLGTGNDKRNIKSIYSYPNKLVELVKNDERYKDQIKKKNLVVTFISNVILFLIITFIFGIFIRNEEYLHNFIYVLILGEFVNLFDLLIIDICWWRNSKRIRLTGYEDKSLYKNITNHVLAFIRGSIMFLIVAAINGYFLTLF